MLKLGALVRFCLLSGVKRTCPFALHMSAFDPKRTSCLVTFHCRENDILNNSNSCCCDNGLFRNPSFTPVAMTESCVWSIEFHQVVDMQFQYSSN